jgi:prepilin-type N-terminal cleavage/methylation domain-containing protein
MRLFSQGTRAMDIKKGFTLLEMMIAIAIFMMIASLVLTAFSNFRARETLNASLEKVLAGFSRARLDSISSRGDSLYGVYILSNEVIYFKGASFPGLNDANNVIFTLPAPIEIANISLNGGGSTVVFQHITGKTTNYGTFSVRVRSDTSISKLITVNQSGAVSL